MEDILSHHLLSLNLFIEFTLIEFFQKIKNETMSF